MTNVTIRGDYLIMAQNFVSNDKTRPYLGGVYVEPHHSGRGIQITATDGHVLGVWYDSEGTIDGDPVIVPLTKDILKTVSGRNGRGGWHIKYDGKVSRVYANRHLLDEAPDAPELMVPCAYIEGVYPDYRRVVPSDAADSPVNALTFRSDQLARFRSCGPNVKVKNALITITQMDSPYSPTIVRTARDDFFGLIMPYRDPAVPLFPEFWR